MSLFKDTKQISMFDGVYDDVVKSLNELGIGHKHISHIAGFIVIEILQKYELEVLHAIRSATSLKALEYRTKLEDLEASLVQNTKSTIYISDNIPNEFSQSKTAIFKNPYVRYDLYENNRQELLKAQMQINLASNIMEIFNNKLNEMAKDESFAESPDYLQTSSIIREFLNFKNSVIDENYQHAYLFITRHIKSKSKHISVYNRDIPSVILVDTLKSHMDHVSIELIQEFLDYRGTDSRDYTQEELLEYANFIRNNF